MLPVYQAISFTTLFDKGGHTRPWGVVVKTERGLENYVAKTFNPIWEDKHSCTTNEVIGNVLAQEFNLPVPKAAYIDFTPEFRQTIQDNKLIEILDYTDDRLKFGTQEITGSVPFDNTVFDSTEARAIIDIDSVFAFDNLIRNGDRTHFKPNLLVKKREGHLIDHELGFSITDKTFKEFTNYDWPVTTYQNHIFYHYLKKSWSSFKDEYFNEFGEYLRTLNVKNLDPYFKQLTRFGFSNVKHDLIKEYLKNMKNNYSNFVKLMGALIT